MKSNKQLCEEYNKITGENVQRFSSKKRGAERIAVLKKGFANRTAARKKPVIKTKTINKIRVDNKNYPSVRAAFIKLGLPINQYRKVLDKLKVCKSAVFMGYKFKNIVRK